MSRAEEQKIAKTSDEDALKAIRAKYPQAAYDLDVSRWAANIGSHGRTRAHWEGNSARFQTDTYAADPL